MYAFWGYDRFPYALGGVVEKIKDGGYVSIKGMNGMIFKPIIILNDDEGIEIRNKLISLENEYAIEKEELLKRFKERSFEIAPFLKK